VCLTCLAEFFSIDVSNYAGNADHMDGMLESIANDLLVNKNLFMILIGEEKQFQSSHP